MDQETADPFGSLKSRTENRPQVSSESIHRFLAGQSSFAQRTFTVEMDEGQRSAGASSGTAMFDTVDANGRQRFVLRFDLGGAFFTQYALAPQFHIMRAIRAAGIPAPAALWLDEAGEMAGTPALIMQRVVGEAPSMQPFSQGLLAEKPESVRRAMVVRTIEMFADLHRLDPGIVPMLADRGQGAHFLDREIDWTRKELLNAFPEHPEHPEHPERASLHEEVRARLLAVADWLEVNAPRQRKAEIAHGDASIANTMFKPDGSIAALLDWELTHQGLGEADLAYFLFASETTRQMAGSAVPSPSDEELIAIYRARRGKLDDWGYARVLGRWRVAVWTAIGLKRMPRELWDMEARLWAFEKHGLEEAIAAT